MKTLLFTTVVCSLTLTVSADGLPELKIPEGVGVNIHFTAGHGRDLDMIAAAGFKWVREDFFGPALSAKKASTTGLSMTR